MPAPGAGEGSPRIRLFGHVNGIYEGSRQSQGPNAPNASSDFGREKGLEVGIGAFGYRRWESSGLALDYHSTFPRYWPEREHSGGNHLLALGFTREITPRLTWSIGESAGSFSNRYLYYNPSSAPGTAPTLDPSTELSDNRTYFLSTLTTVNYRRSQRMFIEMGGGNFLVRRNSASLVGLNAYQANGGVFYSVAPSKIAGVEYSFNHFGYTGGSGNADLHNVGLHYRQLIGRDWELALRAGGYRVERSVLRRVSFDSSLAGATSPAFEVEPSGGVSYHPSIEVRASRQFRHSSLGIDYQQNIDPGNGIYLASKRQSVDVTYTYTGVRRLHVGANGGYGFYKSLAESLGKYRSYRAGGGLTYRIARFVHLMARFESDAYHLRRSDFSRDRYRFTSGLAFASGEWPLPLF